jgi:formate dehydrogenase iron-sulfur subunit
MVERDSHKAKGLLIDVTQCIGCGACVQACKHQNNLPEEGSEDTRLSFRNFTVLENHNGQYVRRLCMHCEHPSCAAVCPVGAITKKETGAVVYDADKCMGCRYCLVACPFEVPTYEWYDPNPRVRKCILCADRIEEGKPTACAMACPTEATMFGDRETLIAIAEARIRKNAEKYHNKIFGLTEVGGTSVMYLSAIPFKQLGFSERITEHAPPEVPWKILQQVPNVVLLGAVFLGGSYWLYRRREEVAKLEAQEKGLAGTEGGSHDD